MATRIGTSPALQKTVVLTFAKKSIVSLSTRFQAQLLIPMFKFFRALKILRIEFPARNSLLENFCARKTALKDPPIIYITTTLK